MTDEFRVFVVDDDPTVVRGLELLLAAHGFDVKGFTSAPDFIAGSQPDAWGCLLLDLRLGSDNGLEIQNELRRLGYTLEIVFLSGRGDVPATARAMREGALDFLEKPIDEPELLEALSRARRASTERQAQAATRRETAERLGRLTRREREVCELIARGLLNKQIAFELRSSENTVKVHRARVMRKLGVDSVASLVRLVSRA